MRIFISYSHRNKDVVERLRTHLKAIPDQFELDVWDDTRIKPGSRWRQEIADAVDSSSAAILAWIPMQGETTNGIPCRDS
jgi:hypothetical protein